MGYTNSTINNLNHLKMHRIFSYNVKIKYFKHVLMDFGPWHLQGLNCMQPLKFNFIILTSLLLCKYRMCRKQNNHIYILTHNITSPYLILIVTLLNARQIFKFCIFTNIFVQMFPCVSALAYCFPDWDASFHIYYIFSVKHLLLSNLVYF